MKSATSAIRIDDRARATVELPNCCRFPVETGETVTTYIRRVRLHHTANEIRSGVKIMAVARGVGYRSYGNFVRAFREAFGTRPHTFCFTAARSELD